LASGFGLGYNGENLGNLLGIVKSKVVKRQIYRSDNVIRQQKRLWKLSQRTYNMDPVNNVNVALKSNTIEGKDRESQELLLYQILHRQGERRYPNFHDS
jgi:hypothetical protein